MCGVNYLSQDTHYLLVPNWFRLIQILTLQFPHLPSSAQWAQILVISSNWKNGNSISHLNYSIMMITQSLSIPPLHGIYKHLQLTLQGTFASTFLTLYPTERAHRAWSLANKNDKTCSMASTKSHWQDKIRSVPIEQDWHLDGKKKEHKWIPPACP